jgi:hypothetical protein
MEYLRKRDRFSLQFGRHSVISGKVPQLHHLLVDGIMAVWGAGDQGEASALVRTGQDQFLLRTVPSDHIASH